MGKKVAFCQYYTNLKTKLKNHGKAFSNSADWKFKYQKKQNIVGTPNNVGWSRTLKYRINDLLSTLKPKENFSEKKWDKNDIA